MTIRTSLQASSSRTLVAAAVLAALALAGCASGGNPNGDSSASNANSNPGAVPVGNVASNGGNVVTQSGKTVSDLGTMIGTAQVPIIGGTAAQKDLGATVTSTGNTVQALGGGISNGLGKIGSTPDPVGTTVQSSGNIVTNLGITAGNACAEIIPLAVEISPADPIPIPGADEIVLRCHCEMYNNTFIGIVEFSLDGQLSVLWPT